MMWDVNSATSRYLSTDFIVSDEKGPVRESNAVGFGKMLIEKHTHHVGLYLVVLTALSVKLYNNSTGAKDGTLKNLLMWVATFHCVVRVDKIKTKRGYYPSCGGEKCKKGNLDSKHGCFWCDSYHNSVDYPVLRYRLELEVSDDTAQTVVVMFDETARAMVKCSAGLIVSHPQTGPGRNTCPEA
nr:hypothetical protein [Tanacetum cinerariifolium]